MAPDCTAIGAYSSEIAAPCAEKRQIDILEGVYTEGLDGKFLASELESLAGRTRGGEKLH